MNRTVYATFADASLAVKAVGALLDHGARNEDISVISREPISAENRDTWEARTADDGPAVSHTTSIDHTTGQGDKVEETAKQGISTTTAADAMAGAAKGAGIGAGVGVAAALASIFIPGFGLVAGGGPLAIALAGAAGATAAGAVAGSVHGYLKDQGVPEESAMDYDRAYKSGWALVTVHVPSGEVDLATATDILSKYHGSSVDTFDTMPLAA